MKPRRITTTLGQHPLPEAGRRGIALLEIVGVLAILAIIAAALAPGLIKRTDQAAWTKESADLATFGDSLQQYIVRNKQVPSETNWAAALASELSMSVGAVATNARGYSRVFLIDPNSSLPNGYVQSSSGVVTNPTSARLMIVSTVSKALPVSSGRPSSTTFNDIWSTAQGNKPSTWTTNWTGKGEDLLIQRVTVDPLFRHLILSSDDIADGVPGQFKIDGANIQSVPYSSGRYVWDRYYFDGSVVRLYNTNEGPYSIFQEILKRDRSFVFENGVWRDQIQGGLRSNASNVFSAQLVTQFLEADTRPRAKADTTEAVILMYDYMFNYVAWATDPDIPFNFYGGKSKDVAQDIMMKAAYDNLKKVTDRLINTKSKH